MNHRNAFVACCVIFLLTAPIRASVGILNGPVTNPASGHRYYLLEQSTWSAAEAEAISLGGHLATVRSAEENDFIYDTFSGLVPSAVQYRWLWIGLNEVALEGDWQWSSGEPFVYSNWAPGQPDDNAGVDEDFAGIALSPLVTQLWHDVSETNTHNDLGWGIVEIVPEPTSFTFLGLAALLLRRHQAVRKSTRW